MEILFDELKQHDLIKINNNDMKKNDYYIGYNFNSHIEYFKCNEYFFDDNGIIIEESIGFDEIYEINFIIKKQIYKIIVEIFYNFYSNLKKNEQSIETINKKNYDCISFELYCNYMENNEMIGFIIKYHRSFYYLVMNKAINIIKYENFNEIYQEIKNFINVIKNKNENCFDSLEFYFK